MDLKRKILLIISTTVFRFAIYFAALTTALVMVFHNADATKQALQSSRAYDRFVPATIESYVNSKQQTGSLPLEDPRIQEIIKRNFNSATLQKGAETIIDSAYDWLNGNVKELTFTVDFSSNTAKLSEELGNYAFDRFAFFPECPQELTEINPFTVKCNPAPVNAEAQRISFINEIKASGVFLPKTTFTAADLPKNPQGKTIVQQYDYAPTLFKLALWVPWVLAGVAIIAAYTIVISGARKRGSFSYIGSSIVGSGIFLAASPLFFLYILPSFVPSYQAQPDSAGPQAVMNSAAKALTTNFNNHLIIIGLVLVVVGLLIWLFERGTRPVSKYHAVRKKSGLVSSILPRTANGRFRLNPDRVPVQTSEAVGKLVKKQPKDKKYRKIPKKEL